VAIVTVVVTANLWPILRTDQTGWPAVVRDVVEQYVMSGATSGRHRQLFYNIISSIIIIHQCIYCLYRSSHQYSAYCFWSDEWSIFFYVYESCFLFSIAADVSYGLLLFFFFFFIFAIFTRFFLGVFEPLDERLHLLQEDAAALGAALIFMPENDDVLR